MRPNNHEWNESLHTLIVSAKYVGHSSTKANNNVIYTNSQIVNQNLASFPCWTVFSWTAESVGVSYLSPPLQYVEELAKWGVHQIDIV